MFAADAVDCVFCFLFTSFIFFFRDSGALSSYRFLCLFVFVCERNSNTARFAGVRELRRDRLFGNVARSFSFSFPSDRKCASHRFRMHEHKSEKRSLWRCRVATIQLKQIFCSDPIHRETTCRGAACAFLSVSADCPKTAKH